MIDHIKEELNAQETTVLIYSLAKLVDFFPAGIRGRMKNRRGFGQSYGYYIDICGCFSETEASFSL